MPKSSKFLSALLLTFSIGAASANGYADQEPGGTDADARMAADDPDEFAWRLFLYINRQAQTSIAGIPEKPTVLQYDVDRDTVWETWALASRDGKPEGEVYLARGAKPNEWKDLPRRTGAPKVLDRTFTNANAQMLQLGHAALRRPDLAPQFVSVEPESDEVRINQSTFTTIRNRVFYSREGQQAAFVAAVADKNRAAIQFDPMAKEVKARWVPIKEDQKNRYHWRQIGGQVYGLAAFHVITKDLPMWFWSDFIHADLEAAEPDPCIDTTTRGPAATHGHDGIRSETVGSKWGNYRLKGTQIAFSDVRGNATILGNQLIEFGNATVSSCMTCHSGAGIHADATPNVFGFITGLPPASVFGSGDAIQVLQSDFLYSMVLRAHSESEPASQPITAKVLQGLREPQPRGASQAIEGFPEQWANRLALRRLQLSQPAPGMPGRTLEFIITPLKGWGAGALIKVAFNGGDLVLHKRIADATQDWSSQANVKFDFGFDSVTKTYRTWSSADSDYKAAIRVSFDQPGYWSLIGRDSIDRSIAGPNEASLNLTQFDLALPSDWRGVAIHEFGHALGFQHEHQSPGGSCEDQFRWDDDRGYVRTRDQFGQFIGDPAGRKPGLYTMLGGPPNRWSAQIVDFNLRQLPLQGNEVGVFDKSSIMKYYFPAWMFKDGEMSACYSPSENTVLSPGDIVGLKRLYPTEAINIQALANDRRHRLELLRGSSGIHQRMLDHLQE